MTYWTYVSLGMFVIGLLALFVIDRIIGTVWKWMDKRQTFRMVDGIRGMKQ